MGRRAILGSPDRSVVFAIIITYILKPRETVSFVAREPVNKRLEGLQNSLFPSAAVNKCFVILL